ncbi:biopolymer transporter ExbD [Silanimonas sp.]|jgi:biopolymer transport protein ExbD|uniref:ExbD/TolR family protein n=1 Tax=Silanimonas sp. TaxID=1929290 RepID=UPI0022CBE601|nr:biopolymer transporter ExbD [Silanimonas sp.]MCZ8062200.1 biopolymer transporter ExbD [Silanimonas sp.]MCZ8166494.1 biopolymer transporter ExbD [Silanimonas sp.]
MAFSSDTDGGFTEPNVVPLVDVMLVLLIIFMVTASVSENVKVELPKATVDARPPAPKVPPITLSVREDGTIFWADEALAGKEMLDTRLAVEAQKEPQPDVLLRADSETKYALIQDVTTRVRVAGMRSINFVSEPESGN